MYKPNRSDHTMPFLEHLGELRSCVLKSLIAIFVGTVGCLSQVKEIWAVLLWPLPKSDQFSLVNVSPTEALMVDFRVALLVGIILSSPYFFSQVYFFIADGLRSHEKKLIIPIIFFSVFFLLLGASFAFFVVIPMGLKFLQLYGSEIAHQTWTQKSYANFVMSLVLTFGVMFQMPVITWFLAKINLLKASFLWSQFKVAVLLIFVISAMLTPPEPVSMLLLALPLILLYLISILIVYWVNPTVKEVVISA